MTRILRAFSVTVRLVEAAGLLGVAPPLWAGPLSQPATVPETRPATEIVTTALIPQVPTVEAIKARIEQVQADTQINPAVRDKVLEIYGKAIANLERSAGWVAAAGRHDQDRLRAPELLETLRRTATAPASRPESRPLEQLDDVQLDQVLTEVRAEQERLQQAFEKSSDELKQRPHREAETRRLIEARQQQLAQTEQQLAAPEPVEAAELAAAGRVLLQTRKKALDTEIQAAQAELHNHQVTDELLRLQRDIAAAGRDDAARRVAAILDQRNDRAQRRAAQDAERTRRELERARAAAAPPVVLRITQENQALSEARTAAGPRELDRLLEAVRRELDRIREERAGISKRIEAIGMTNEVGVLLRRYRRTLPALRQYEQQRQEHEAERFRLELQLIELKERRDRLHNIPQRAAQLTEDLADRMAAEQRTAVRERVAELLRTNRDLLESLLKDRTARFNALVALIQKERELIAEIEQYRDYIDENILWVRTAELPQLGDLAALGGALQWLADPPAWAALLGALGGDVRGNPLIYVLAVVLATGFLIARRLMQRRIRRIGAQIAKPPPARIGPTLEVLAMSLLAPVLWPAVVLLIAWRLDAAASGEFELAIADGLRAAALILLLASGVRQLVREGGLADAHFRWPRDVLARLRRASWMLAGVLMPIAFLVSAVEAQSQEAHKGSLGRYALIVGLALVALCLGRLLRGGGPVLAESNPRVRASWVYRLRHVWYPLVIGVPLLLILLAVLGYVYTAVLLSWRMLAQYWLALGLLVVSSTLFLWLRILARRLALKEAAKRRAAQQQGAEPAAAPGAGEQDAGLGAAAIASIGEQTRRFVRYALGLPFLLITWGIWADVFPALGRLNDIQLYRIDENTITVAKALWALLAAVLTVAAGRNLPALLEVTILRRLPVKPGVPYAITSVSRYVIAIIGVAIVFSVLGVGWDKVQWIVGALTFGLAFGLQEIFANFVSGLIILFERPIRVGDVVTIGQTTGTVTRIRIRATTVTDWDRKELVVPNKEFITKELINWTLSDRIIRLTVRVGIAYGSDTRRARALLLKVAEENEGILKDPAPMALFLGFGDNALNFELRFYLMGLENYLAVLTDTHMAIDQAFREAGITIAFPQRDVHFRPGEPLRIEVVRPPADRS
jgi:potassium efflux system protein